MKTFRRLTASVLAMLMSINGVLDVGAFAHEQEMIDDDDSVYCDQKEDNDLSLSENADLITPSGIEHAYDPTKELLSEQQEREFLENVEKVENKIIFSVIDRHDDSENVDVDKLCKDHKLKKATLLIETKAENYDDDVYEVFYEAKISGDVVDAIEKLKEDERVCFAEPDYIWEDTGFADASAEELSNAACFPSMGVQESWDDLFNDNIKAPGYGSVVAVIDTGIDYNHFELKNNMWKNPGEIPGNRKDDDGNGYVDDVYGYDFVENDGDPMDDHGHGTHVAGIIAMAPGNGGGVGVAYGAKVMAVKAGQATGSFASSDIVKAIKYAADNGADVINMSFGGTGKSHLVEMALADAMPYCVLVAAAGNDGLPTTDYPYQPKEDFYPAGYQYVLGVMATYDNGAFAGFSNWDYIEGQNCEYEMAAPGVAIYSTLPGNRFANWSGTSMAAPNVSAAAAILRSKFKDKSRYTSRFIMGQLTSATEDRTSKVGKMSDVHFYPALNIYDSITKTPKPRVVLNDFYMFDDPEISPNNNGDGIAQPGEIIDLGISAFNYWGIAKDVTISIDTLSDGGIPNPHAEIIKGSINIGEIGTFANGTNGFTYTDGALTGVSNPLRIKIKEGTPNDIQIPINFTVTCKNGMNSADRNVYNAYGDLKPTYTVIVQNGYAISGVINEDMTLTNDKYWIIQNNLLIPEGVTVTVEPGTQIQFWSADPANPYADSQNVYIQVEGRFIAEGTEEQPIEMFAGKGFEGYPVVITNDDSGYRWATFFTTIDLDYSKSYASLKYVNIIDASGQSMLRDYDYFIPSDRQKRFIVTLVDHCKMMISHDNEKLTDDNITARRITNSIFENYKNSIVGKFFKSSCGEIDCIIFENNLFSNSDVNFRDDAYAKCISMKNNVFLQTFKEYPNDKYYSPRITIPYYYDLSSIADEELLEIDNQSIVKNNAVLSQLWTRPSGNIRIFGGYSGHNTYDISGNYWGTTNPDLVKLQCYDADWNVSLDQLVQEPFLTLDDDMSEIYPFVTEAYLTDKDGNRIDTVNGSQQVSLHVKFNRDMAQDIQPMVTYGGSEPYTDYITSGDWVSAREWVSDFTISQFVDLGRMYIRVKGAAAADDRWLVTGEDGGRFFFEVKNLGAQAMSLQSEPTSEGVLLNWMQDDFDTLAGYNVYRSENYVSDKAPEEQNFKRINSSVLTSEELSYMDTDATPDKDYYYYFTVVKTDLTESKASNVVTCTPLDIDAPTIAHTAKETHDQDMPLVITAQVNDNVSVDKVELFYKKESQTEWSVLEMRNVLSDVYKATISAAEITGEDIEYYIKASDGTNETLSASSDEPYRVLVHEQTGIEITHAPYKLNYDLNEDIDLNGLVVSKIYNKGEKVQVTDYEISGFDSIEPGEKTITVTASGFTAEFTVNVEHHHIYISEITLSATCTEDGIRSYYCTKCGDSYTETIKATGHMFKTDKVAATCTEGGTIRYECSICGYSYMEETEPAGHNYRISVVEPTYTSEGYTLHTCTLCGDSYRDEFTSVKQHEYTSEVILEPTCTENGLRRYSCTECENSYTEIIPKSGHAYDVTVIRPTCTTDGYTVHKCSVCGDEYTDSIVPARGHTYVTDRQEATCTSEGYTAKTCVNCGDKEITVIPAKGHSFVDKVIEPTCDSMGYTSHTCTTCGYSYNDNYTDKLVTPHTHSYTDKITKQPTCTEEGIRTFTCSCGDSETVVIPATGHKYEETIIPPTCTRKGYTLHKCSVCGDEYRDNYTDEIEYIAPTISFKSGDSYVDLTWTEVAGAEKYAVCGFVNDNWQILAKTDGTSYTLENLKAGNEYKIAVIAKIGGKWEQDYSNAIVVTTKPEETPAYPEVSVEYNEQYHQFRLNWTKVPNAQNYGVAVYLAGRWKVQKQDIPATTTLFTSPKLRAGQTYKMVVCAKVDGRWDISNLNSRAVTVTVK